MKNPDRKTISQLENLPNVGKAIAEKLRLIGIDHPKKLIGKQPLELYDQLCIVTKERHDPCVIDTFMSIVHFMESGEVLPWWAFTDKRKRGNKMKYGYTIIYVSSVEETLDFYYRAFGFEIKFIDETKAYGELNTGDTTLAFASHKMGDMNLGGEYRKSNIDDTPLGIELAFVTEDVSSAYGKAVSAGALPIKEPEEKPWGQVVGYVRSVEGSIIEICTPIGD